MKWEHYSRCKLDFRSQLYLRVSGNARFVVCLLKVLSLQCDLTCTQKAGQFHITDF